MKLIVGLGNPGKEYEKSRHNTGWMVLESLVKELEFEELKKESKFKANISRGGYMSEKIIFAQPTTFMNLSGDSVRTLIKFYKLKLSDLWVIYDDIDLPIGQLRIRKEGGAGTHNGMKSIIESLSSGKFPRFRVGIESRGLTAPKEQDTTSFVLETFSRTEELLAISGRKKAVAAVIMALQKDLDTAMNFFNNT